MPMTRRSIWFSIRDSLWFVPFLLVVFSIVSALVLVQLDAWLDARQIKAIPDSLAAGPDGARQILSIIASATITVAGVIFSITIVTLSLAAAQYSPRVLRSFMRDRLNQAVLGVLVGVFSYSLLVLRTIRSDGDVFVPQLSLWLGILLVLVAIGFFIAFIHNTAVSIQSSEIIARITHETLSALDASQHAAHEGGTTEEHREQLQGIQWQCIPSRESGYVQDVDVNALFTIARERQAVLQVECPVGDFVVAGLPLVLVGNTGPLEKALIKKVQRQFGINSYRTVEQDPAFGVRQIVDIALKALSPSINDTTTAIHCVDYLGIILDKVVKSSPLPHVHTDRGKVRLILEQPDTAYFIDVALNEIRQNARGNVAVLMRMFRLTRQLLEAIDNPTLAARVKHHIRLIAENIDRDVPSPADRVKARDAAERALRASRG
jgi:uncharacterized membrane protein